MYFVLRRLSELDVLRFVFVFVVVVVGAAAAVVVVAVAVVVAVVVVDCCVVVGECNGLVDSSTFITSASRVILEISVNITV